MGSEDYEEVWRKNPYPEKESWMYGFTQFAIQLNYFPSWLQSSVPPTDSRRRPDQRCLENGDFENASNLKDLLEVKQRAVRVTCERCVCILPALLDDAKSHVPRQGTDLAQLARDQATSLHGAVVGCGTQALITWPCGDGGGPLITVMALCE